MPAVQIRVLGPVEVLLDRHEVRLSRLERHLIAVLAVDPAKTVSVDLLAESLWADDQPSNARNRIQALVSSLRRGLGDAIVVTQPPGYRLGPEVRCDSADFAADISRGDPDSLRRALDRWRGTAFDGVHDPLLETAATRLHEQRIAATETLIELELAAGRHADWIAELTGLVAASPLRERLRAHLMTALYGAGRTADALAVYREGRQLIADELGIEPGPALQALHQAILSGDLVLDLAPAAPAINQLPPATSHFVGREAEVEAITGWLAATPHRAGPAIVAISGVGGLGKTYLAVRAARDLLGSYPDGCLFTDLRGVNPDPADPHAVIGNFLRALGVDGTQLPHDRDERLGLFRSATAKKRLLLVLDNAGGAAQVRPLLPGGEGCGVIVTSRQELSTLDNCRLVTPAMFSMDESRSLLDAIVGAQRLGNDLDGVRELVRFCAGMPLAVRIVAARLAGKRELTPTRLSQALSASRSPVQELAAGDLGVSASLMLSFERLNPLAAELFPLLGRSGDLDYTDWNCTVLLGEPASPALRELTASHLVSTSDGDRFHLHDLVKTFAGTLPADPIREATALDGLYAAYIDSAYRATNQITAGQASKLYKPQESSALALKFVENGPALEWFDDECNNVVALVRHAARTGRPREAWQLAFGARSLFRYRHRLDEWLETIGIGLRAAMDLQDPLAEALTRQTRGGLFIIQERATEALAEFMECLRLQYALGNTVLAGFVHSDLGIAHQALGNLDAADEHMRKALANPEYAADVQQSAWTHNNLGTLAGRRGNLEEACAHFQHAVLMAQNFQDWPLACSAYHNLAFACNLMGRADEAAGHARQEIDIAQRSGLLQREAMGWEILGDSLALGDRAAAARAWQEAVTIYEQLRSERADVIRQRLTGD